MSESSKRHRDDERALQIALFRYGVIAPILECDDIDRGELSKHVAEIAGETHYLPGTGPRRICERTVYAWLRLFRREGGIDALRPRFRKDRGHRRVVDDAVLERAIALRKENPERWTSTLLDILKREGSLRGKTVPHRATLDRHLARRGASRRQMRALGQKRTIKMRFDDFGDLWVGDYHHGPLVLAPDGRPTTAKLGAFIDHTTRYPVADRYYLAEDLASLRDTLLRAFLRFGRARKIYVDRGAVYRAEQLAYSLRRIDIVLIHSRAYYSQGRGVIEKWWQIADQFESEVRHRDGLMTLHELNSFWEAWREERYCHKPHSELGKTPHEAIAGVIPKPLDPAIARELFLLRAERTVHKRDACVAVEGRRYLCESFLRGKRVEVRYDLAELGSVLVFHDGNRVGRAFPQEVNATPEPHPEAVALPKASVDYLALLREDYDKKLLEHARPLRYAELRTEPGFDAERFIEVVAALAGVARRPAIDSELRAFFETYGPFPEELARIGVEHALRLHGRGRHVRLYLHAVRTLVLAHFKSSPKE